MSNNTDQHYRERDKEIRLRIILFKLHCYYVIDVMFYSIK